LRLRLREKIRMSNHTPGPWITDLSHVHEWEGTTIWSGSNVIAHVVADHHNNETANAQLIAAAPRMLEALKTVSLCLDGEHVDGCDWGECVCGFSVVETAIKKAEGG
jgi:hypothetical protein